MTPQLGQDQRQCAERIPRIPHLFVGVALFAVACGGLVEGGSDSHPTESAGDNDGATLSGGEETAPPPDAPPDSQAVGGTAPNPVGGTDPAQRPGDQSLGCSCPEGVDYFITVTDPDGGQMTYASAPKLGIAPSDALSCGPYREPGYYSPVCGEHLLGACDEKLGCAEILVEPRRAVMNIWSADWESVTAIESDDYDFTIEREESVNRGELAMRDDHGRRYQVDYALCELRPERAIRICIR